MIPTPPPPPPKPPAPPQHPLGPNGLGPWMQPQFGGMPIQGQEEQARQAQQRLARAREQRRIADINREAESLERGWLADGRCECCGQPLPRQSQVGPVGRAYPSAGPAST